MKKVKDKKKNQKDKHSPHDAFVKRVLEDVSTAQEFLDEYLPPKFKEFVDLSSLKVKKESYIEESLKNRLSDIRLLA